MAEVKANVIPGLQITPNPDGSYTITPEQLNRGFRPVVKLNLDEVTISVDGAVISTVREGDDLVWYAGFTAESKIEVMRWRDLPTG